MSKRIVTLADHERALGEAIERYPDLGCRCDPPGSGEEHCTGHCYVRARLKARAANEAIDPRPGRSFRWAV